MSGILSILRIAPPFDIGQSFLPSLESWLFDFLTGDSRITSLIGTRVYEDMVPQPAEYPAVSYSIVGGERGYTINDTDKQAKTLMQVSVWARSGVSRRKVSDAIERRLTGYSGTYHRKVIQSVFLDNELNVMQPEPGNESQRLYGRHLDFEIVHVVNVPKRYTEE